MPKIKLGQVSSYQKSQVSKVYLWTLTNFSVDFEFSLKTF